MNIIEVKNKDQLQDLAKSWAMTWEGLRTEDFEVAMENCCKEGKDGIGYLLSGKTMNELCALSGNNAYPNDINIFCIKDFKGLAINYGARWLYDVIWNNAQRENYLPFSLD